MFLSELVETAMPKDLVAFTMADNEVALTDAKGEAMTAKWIF
jgi:hypothetical protein